MNRLNMGMKELPYFPVSLRYSFLNSSAYEVNWEKRVITYTCNLLKSHKRFNIWEECNAPIIVEALILVIWVFGYLSALPNFHKWQWNDLLAKLWQEQKFSTTCWYYPWSPRNRIIQSSYFRGDNFEIRRTFVMRNF